MERLTADDRLMLWPDELWPQEIGALAVLDGTPLTGPDGRLRLDIVRAAVRSRLHLVPRFHQVLLTPRRWLGPPLWVDAPDVVLGEHIRVAEVPPPGGESELLHTVERLRAHRLDRARPLWEMWLLTGLPQGRLGLYVRMHHAIADGIAGVASIEAFFDNTARASDAPTQPWTAAPWPTRRELLADTLRRRLNGLRHGLSVAIHPVATSRRALAGLPSMGRLAAPRTTLDHVVGPHRRLAIVRGDLNEVKSAAHRHGAKVNDVVLTVVAGGLRRLLGGRGECVDQLPVYVPVTLRHGTGAPAQGNLIAQMVVPLPLAVADPATRLGIVAAETARRKAATHPRLGALLNNRLARRALLALLKRQPVSVTTADVPGPGHPLYFAGARLIEVFPVLPLIGSVTLGIAALSYAGQFNLTVVADRDVCPDLEAFTAGVRDDLSLLSTMDYLAPEGG
jgi:diacylglycerol O-acyltransferase / wax synthase